MSIRLQSIKTIIKQSKQETVSSTYHQRDDFLPEKWHKTPSASGKIDQMTGSVQLLILPVFHTPAWTAKRTVSSKILIVWKRLKLKLCVSLESQRSQTQKVHYALHCGFESPNSMLSSFYHSNIIISNYFIEKFQYK